MEGVRAQLKGTRQAKDPAPDLQKCSLGAVAPGQVEGNIVFWDIEIKINISKIRSGWERYFATQTYDNYSRPCDYTPT